MQLTTKKRENNKTSLSKFFFIFRKNIVLGWINKKKSYGNISVFLKFFKDIINYIKKDTILKIYNCVVMTDLRIIGGSFDFVA